MSPVALGYKVREDSSGSNRVITLSPDDQERAGVLLAHIMDDHAPGLHAVPSTDVAAEASGKEAILHLRKSGQGDGVVDAVLQIVDGEEARLRRESADLDRKINQKIRGIEEKLAFLDKLAARNRDLLTEISLFTKRLSRFAKPGVRSQVRQADPSAKARGRRFG